MKRIMLLASVLAACVSSDQLRRNQYDADYQRALQQCGQTDAAFQSGYNEGYAGSRMRADWTVMCTPEVRAQTAASYQNGFLRGANDAPVRVVHTVKPIRVTGPRSTGTTTTTSVAECTFDSDCGDGYHCRDKTCMGQGYTGERCVFNDDCLSDHCFGGTCRE